MVGTILLTLSIAQSREAPQQKSTLPNGVVLYTEQMVKASGFTLHLFVSTLGFPEDDETHGHRHLLEHLVAKGEDRAIDAQLEVNGMTLTAATLRDGLRFEIEGPSEALPLAIESMRQLTKSPDFTKEEIAKEVSVMEQEFALSTDSDLLARALWAHAFSDEESDPYGTLDAIKTATPESLKQLYDELFVASSMTVVAVGDIDAGTAMTQLSDAFVGLQLSAPKEVAKRPAPEEIERGFAAGASGTGRGVYVSSFDHPKALATIAAAFAIQNEVPGTRMIYTASPFGALVCVVNPNKSAFSGLDSLVASGSSRLYVSGRAALTYWLNATDVQSRDKARMYGQMLLLERSFRLKDFQQRATRISRAAFATALMQFRTDTAVRVGGSR